MAKRTDIKSILVIGSGPIIIGQAAEFDYAGTQACLSLKEEGYKVILINSNPATIMTDKNIADEVYIEPLTLEFVTKIIQKTRPDALLPTLGGQVALNLAVKLDRAGVLDKYGVKILGSSLDTINKAEDREAFRALMYELNEPVPPSIIANSVESALNFAKECGYPVVVRPAFTMGGTGGGICENEVELKKITKEGLIYSPTKQCLIEKSIAGFKELEYEVMRDSKDQAILICDMENIDPVGIHTGDSLVVAPTQTLTKEQDERMKNVALKLIKALKIEGGCNVQIAHHLDTDEYYIIEVNPRVSRSSALASKATSFPIAKIAAKIAVGLTLDEIYNEPSGRKYIDYKPNLDYIVTKVPRFAFDKFKDANRYLGTQMKATGEVMGLGKTLSESILKGIKALEYGICHLGLKDGDKYNLETIKQNLKKASDERVFFIGEALRRGVSVDEIHELTKINKLFLNVFKQIIDTEHELKADKDNVELIKKAKQIGLSDRIIAHRTEKTQAQIRQIRWENGIFPSYKISQPQDYKNEISCFYSTYLDDGINVKQTSKKGKIIVLGSGPIRIGQGIEFDYSSVHAIWAIRELGYEAIIINNNPETLSTDYLVADKLYFEPLGSEEVLEIIRREEPIGVVVSFGGQTAINLTQALVDNGVKILGTSLDSINLAEDRKQFEALLRKININQPKGKTAISVDEALQNAKDIGYPVLVRPSFVLGGRAMQVVYNDNELIRYMQEATSVSEDKPILVDKYLCGKELEVDAVCDGNSVYIPGILEHIERAGVHSGDSIAIYPPISISDNVKNKIIDYTKKLALALDIKGLLNIQYVLFEDEVYVLEVNPRASRTLPFLSKIVDINLANVALKVILGKSLKEQGISCEYKEKQGFYSVKVPVFSFSKLALVDTVLGPEMKSTGEVMGTDISPYKALYKGLLASGVDTFEYGGVLFSVDDKNKEEALSLAKEYYALGYDIVATQNTAKYFENGGLKARIVNKIGSKDNDILDEILDGKITLVINTPSGEKTSLSDGFKIRRLASECSVASFTSLDTARAYLYALKEISFRLKAL